MNKNTYDIPKSDGMNVPGIVYANSKLIDAILLDETLNQIKNVAKLPGIIKASIAMPDAQQGFGFSIGGVAAFDLETGVISPGGVGYDINCGIRILLTNLKKKDIDEVKEKLLERLYNKVPSGVAKGSPFQVSKRQLDELLIGGAKWIVEKGYGVKEDYIHCEEGGCIPNADPSLVSERAKKRGIGQVGTLGAGNHFLEIQEVTEIFNKDVAKAFGVKKGQIIIMIHCGSRGLGHQVASDYIEMATQEYGAKSFPVPELANAPINSDIGRKYLSAMNCAANFAFANRQLIGHWVREVFTEVIPKSKIKTLYDICHNIAKVENHLVDGRRKDVCVHRKGATRSFGPGRIEIPEIYRKVGQPVLLPGSMGTSSYILVGTKTAEKKSFGSCSHGAGRLLSRSKAVKTLNPTNVQKEMKDDGVLVKTGHLQSLAEEAPQAYKDVDEVVKVISEEGLAGKVAKVKPLLVVKG